MVEQASKLAIATFATIHIGLLLTYNLVGNGSFMASRYCALTATSQNWGMFAPNVENRSALPVLALRWPDGRVSVFHSDVEPPWRISSGDGAPLSVEDIPEQQRAYGWRFHFLDARRRGLAGAVVTGGPGVTPLRIAFVRKWLAQVLRSRPYESVGIPQVSLCRWVFTHPGSVSTGRIVAIDWLMTYDPSTDAAWSESSLSGMQP